jgi:DNA topoisomerase-1
VAGRLRRSDCSAAGIGRVRRGRGFGFVDADGERVSDDETIERIAELAIPPAWGDVWVCPDPLGHIQATGVDDAGRKQYLYHQGWQRRAAARKFEAAREFGRTLPKLRRAARTDLKREGAPRERALACAVTLLDLGFFRVGGERYAEENESFGLATLLREHLTIADGEAVFDFPAKSGQRRVQSVGDEGVIEALEAMRRRRSGPDDLLVYKERGRWQDVRSEDINEYIQEKAGEEFSAKDFRTWHGLQAQHRRLDPRSGQAGRRAPRQHPGGGPSLLHRPLRDRSLPRWRTDRPPGGDLAAARPQAAGEDRAPGPGPARRLARGSAPRHRV